jgi:hypothetical protein
MANKTPEEKSFLNCACKFGVVGELLKRNVDARIALGGLDKINIQVFYKDHSYKTVAVRSSDTNRIVTRFWQKYINPDTPHPDYWVLVHVDCNKVSHYYIYKHDDLGKVQTARTGHAPRPGGVDNVELRHISDHENLWDIIVNNT